MKSIRNIIVIALILLSVSLSGQINGIDLSEHIATMVDDAPKNVLCKLGEDVYIIYYEPSQPGLELMLGKLLVIIEMNDLDYCKPAEDYRPRTASRVWYGGDNLNWAIEVITSPYYALSFLTNL